VLLQLAAEPFRTVDRGRPWRTVRGEHAVVALGPSPALTIVDGVRADGDVAAALEEVREVVRADGRTAAVWAVGPLSEPGDVGEQLIALGLVPNEVPPFAPEGTALALTRPPDLERPADVVARPADDVTEAFRLLARTNGLPEPVIDEWAAAFTAGFEPERASVYVAELGGEPVAAATALYTDAGLWLTGAGTLPEARGRGAYRALIAARWDEAVERGTPALTVQAGAMSRPVLERAGFEPLASLRYLRDEL
jgi:GNAT superfamily N-acetyltransferase